MNVWIAIVALIVGFVLGGWAESRRFCEEHTNMLDELTQKTLEVERLQMSVNILKAKLGDAAISKEE